MAEENLRELAKQGNAKAIAVLLNRPLQAKNINAQVSRQDDCLQILLESVKIPNQNVIVSFIQKGLTNLGITSITTVKIDSYKTGENSPAWSQTFELASPKNIFSFSEPTDSSESPAESTTDAVSQQFEPEDDPSTSRNRDVEDSLSGANLSKINRRTISEEDTPLRIRQRLEQEPRRSLDRSSNIRDRQPLKPLSVGNVVNAGLRLYRDRFKLYLGLAFQAFFWSFIPIYGWAKHCQIQAIIARHSFSELINQPETVTTIRTELNLRLWDFWVLQILIGFMVYAVYIGLLIVLNLVNLILEMLSSIFSDNIALIIILVILQLVAMIGFITTYLWFYAHFFIAELPLALEDKMSSTGCISRSWTLTKGFVWRIESILLVAALITIPLTLIAALPLAIIIPIFTQLINPLVEPSSETIVSALITIMFIVFIVVILSLLVNTLLMPFWQAIKAVIYYDLRSRREGLGLEFSSQPEMD